MSLEQISTVMQDMMMTTLIVAAPMLLAALLVGLLPGAMAPRAAGIPRRRRPMRPPEAI